MIFTIFIQASATTGLENCFGLIITVNGKKVKHWRTVRC